MCYCLRTSAVDPLQPGNPYGDNPTEPNWQLQAIVIALSGEF